MLASRLNTIPSAILRQSRHSYLDTTVFLVGPSPGTTTVRDAASASYAIWAPPRRLSFPACDQVGSTYRARPMHTATARTCPRARPGYIYVQDKRIGYLLITSFRRWRSDSRPPDSITTYKHYLTRCSAVMALTASDNRRLFYGSYARYSSNLLAKSN